MAPASFTESVVGEAALAWLVASGYAMLHGPNIASGELYAERADYGDVLLTGSRPPERLSRETYRTCQ